MKPSLERLCGADLSRDGVAAFTALEPTPIMPVPPVLCSGATNNFSCGFRVGGSRQWPWFSFWSCRMDAILIMKAFLFTILSAAALVVTGCSSTQQFVPFPDQSKVVEDPSMGRIYVMRPATVGAAISMDVADDGKIIGSTGPHGFLCWERKPGDAVISSKAENTICPRINKTT